MAPLALGGWAARLCSATGHADDQGLGDASVTVNKMLEVQIADSDDVVYGGQAVLIQTMAGSGSISRR